MTDYVVSDGYKYPQDEGLPNIGASSKNWHSAGHLMLLAQAVNGGSFVRTGGLTFSGHDAANDQVNIDSGIAYLDLSGETVNIQPDTTGSGAAEPAHDTAVPQLPAIMVALPTGQSDVDLQDSTLTDVWVAYATDGNVTNVSAGDVWVRTDHDGGQSAPPHPSVKIGQSNPDNSSEDTLLNRGWERFLKDGESHEIDVAELAGGLGSAGMVAQTDGADVTWVTLPHDDLTSVGANDHHQDPTAGGGLTDEGTNQFGLDSVANGDDTLSSGTATIDTGHAIDDSAEYTVMINPDDGADIAASLEEGGTNYQLHLEENTTSVGNPGCRWRLLRYN